MAKLQLMPGRWSGNHWPCIDIEPGEYDYFLPLLFFLQDRYQFAAPAIVGTPDGYVAEFALRGARAILFIDNWGFSLAVEEAAVRDEVLAVLRALPETFFDAAPRTSSASDTGIQND